MESLRAFVTGGTGFIGSHLVEEIVRNNLEVRILVRDRQKAMELFINNVEVIRSRSFRIFL